MNRFVLDSSAILHIVRGTKAGREIARFVQEADVLVSVLSYCEVLNAAEMTHLKNAEEFLSNLPLLPLELRDGHVAKELQISCRRSGAHVATPDCLVAATAINHDAEIVTTDTDFNRIDGVKKHVF